MQMKEPAVYFIGIVTSTAVVAVDVPFVVLPSSTINC
jgi:hypothetical protein